jgi:glucose/arabinose dehydrogenase
MCPRRACRGGAFDLAMTPRFIALRSLSLWLACSLSPWLAAGCSRPTSSTLVALQPAARDAGGSLAAPLDGGPGAGGHDPSSSDLDATPGAAPQRACVEAEGTLPALRLAPIVTGLAQPTYAVAPPGDAQTLFVLERAGVVRIVRAGRLLPEPFLDLSARVATGGDQGLLGLAFHPAYADNGRLFVMYALRDPAADPSEQGDIVVSELARSLDNPDRADDASERRLIQIQPASAFHAGGQLAFDPRERLLYIGVGDGGARAAGDRSSLLGKVLRIDVDGATSERPYGIPAGNMSGPDVLPELWSYGLRNPWRFSFDPCTAALYIGDVGEAEVEEIDLEPADTPGRDYGWSRFEGSRCLEGDGGCDPSGVTLPVLEYERDFGCAIIAGYVYRGQAIPALRGTYLYGDYCTGRIGGFRVVGDQVVDARELTAELNPDALKPISSFALDAAGELHVLTLTGGLYRLEPR